MNAKGIPRTLLEKLVIYMNYASCALTVFLCLWILVDIFGRYLFNSPIPGTAELAGNVIIGVLFLGVASVELRREHIRSDLLMGKLRSKPQIVVEIVSMLMGLMVFVFGFISSFGQMRGAWRILEYDGEGSLHIPTYPFKTIVVIGCVFVIIQLLFNLKDSIVALFKKEEGEGV